jgi:hypothetical protein
VQQRAQNAPHMRIVVDDEKPKAIEIDAEHGTTQGRGRSGLATADGKFLV